MKPGQIKKGVAKGAPSGILLSILIHAGLIAIAVSLTVFTLKKQKIYINDPVPAPERPKFDPKIPHPRIDKKRRPAASERIVAQMPKNREPEFQLPDLPGKGTDILGGAVPGGGISIVIPEIPDTPISVETDPDTGNNLIVTYYNLNRRKDGGALNIDYQEYFAILRDYVDSGWDPSKLSRFYRSPRRLKATTIMIPITSSILGPAAFGEDINEGYCWVVHYKGKLVHKEGLTFRFWGASDDVLTVRVDGKTVLAANLEWTGVDAYLIANDWVTSAPNSRKYRLASQKMVGGDWITLAPGVPLDMEAIAGEGPGGEFHAQLLVEVQGEEYPLNDRGAPIYPIFAMEEPSWALQDVILENMFEGEANVTNVTTIFRDY